MVLSTEVQAQRSQPKGVSGAATLITVTNVSSLLPASLVCQLHSSHSDCSVPEQHYQRCKGHCQGARSREPKIRSPSWAALSRKTQSLFLSLLRLSPPLARAHQLQAETETQHCRRQNSCGLQGPSHKLNKELMKRTVHLQVLCALAKLSCVKAALIFEVNGKKPEQCALQQHWTNGSLQETSLSASKLTDFGNLP